MELHKKTICELKEMIDQKQVSCLEVTDAYIDRISQVDNTIESYITNTFDKARDKANMLDERLSKGEDIGPLGGIPYALKDNMCTKDILTTCSSQLLKNFVPPYNAFCL